MAIADRIIFGFIFLSLLAMLLLIPFSVKKQSDFEVACKEAGGVPYTAIKSYNLCLNPTAIVELK